MKTKIVTTGLACIALCAGLILGGCDSKKTYEALVWPSSGLFTEVPNPNAEYGKIGLDLEDSASVYVDQTTKEDWDNYVNACKEAGYTIDDIENDDSYSAYNEEGYQIDTTFNGYDEDNINYDIFIYAPRNKGAISWPTIGLATLLPTPPSSVGEIIIDSDSQFNANICEMDYDTYTQYVADCQAAGFTVDYSSYDTVYDADNENGDSLRLEYLGFNTMNISMYASDDETSESTDTTNDTVITEETGTDASEQADNSTDIDPDFKETMDNYEAFFDEYIEFMQSYEDSSDLKALADYTSMMSKYAEFTSQIDAIDTENLNDAELAYYTEVTTRVTQKLLDASLDQ